MLADEVPIKHNRAIFRDAGIALTETGQTRPEARAFSAFLSSSRGATIFAKWGWIAPDETKKTECLYQAAAPYGLSPLMKFGFTH